MNSKIKDPNTDLLFNAILKLETPEECYRFFEDLCTSGKNAYSEKSIQYHS